MSLINELRIGNCVSEVVDTTNGERLDLFVVNAINNETSTLLDTDSNITSIEYIKPIPLTEELLIKLGFEKVGEVYTLSLAEIYGNPSLELLKGDDKIEICRSGICAFRSECKHVHELQNLYFALTKTELI